MERVLAAVVFGDLSGFTALADALDEAAYVAFMTEFRGVVHGCIAPFETGNRLEYAFWGDEVKVLFLGRDPARNAREALACARELGRRWDDAPTSRSRRAAGAPPVTFKVGVATGELTVGMFPGARSPESEGRPLCTARTLSKWAKLGVGSRVYVDASTRALSGGEVALVPVAGHADTWEAAWQ
jgi:class 3 adenylate cyclase